MNSISRSQYHQILGLLLIMLAIFGLAKSADDDSGARAKCATEFQKVMQCLPFVTNKANAPSKECCDSATELKNTDPACLCYIIQQIHNGSNPAVKTMGVQETRLLQLPAACKMTNASVSECPKLLHLAPNSPDAAIFTNTSVVITNTTPGMSTSPATPSSSPSSSSNSGISFSHKPPQFVRCLIITITVALFFHALSLPMGIA